MQEKKKYQLPMVRVSIVDFSDILTQSVQVGTETGVFFTENEYNYWN